MLRWYLESADGLQAEDCADADGMALRPAHQDVHDVIACARDVVIVRSDCSALTASDKQRSQRSAVWVASSQNDK